MSQKVFRDPLYNYLGIDLPRDRWLLGVIDCREFQRLRRIHQLGISSLEPLATASTMFGHVGLATSQDVACEGLVILWNTSS